MTYGGCRKLTGGKHRGVPTSHSTHQVYPKIALENVKQKKKQPLCSCRASNRGKLTPTSPNECIV